MWQETGKKLNENKKISFRMVLDMVDYLVNSFFFLFCFRSVKIQIVNMISVGFVWVHGNLTVLHGTIVIVTMRMRLKRHVMLKKN